jgi:DNA uptake protein ComE-like DNA-binding protein
MLLPWAAGPWVARAAESATSSTSALRADLTDQMLRALAAAPELAPRAAARPSTATQKMASSAKLPPRPAKMVITARPTSATMALRQAIRPKPTLAGSGATSTTRRAPASLQRPRVALPPTLAANLATTTAPPRPATLPLRTTSSLASPPELNPALLALAAAPRPAPAPTPAMSVAAVRINRAGEEELREKLKLDGTRARLVVQFRTLYGAFKTPEDLSQVSGITEEMVKGWDEERILYFD